MVNKHLFELYIRDLLAAITNNSAIQLSLGLPSHHAHPTYPSGFCFINKLAVLAIFNEKLHEAPIRHLSIGIDVNHDDGLKAVLEKTEIKYHLIDALDEEVFPKTSLKALTDEEKYHAYTVGGKRPRPKVPPLYQQELGQIVGYQLTPAKAHNSFSTLLGFNMNYPHEPQVCSAFALNLYHRKDIRSPHPILNHIFTLLEREIKAHKHLVFYIPLGFDSSINDCTFDHDITVAKGQTLDEVKRNRRFTTQDYIFFYKKLLDLYKANPEKIKAIYISLEGGYDANVLPHELRILIEELDVLNQSYYQNLNMQITIHEEEKLWALVVPKLQRALENNKLSFAERYSLLSKLCYAHVECQQTPEAQRIYQQLKTMEETASEDFITQGNSKTKKRKRDPLHHSPLFAKKDSSQSTEAEKVDYLSKLENITKVLLDSHLYTHRY